MSNYKKMYMTDDTNIIVHVKGDSIKVKSSAGYSLPEESILMKIKDNGNGYYVTLKSYSSVYPDHKFNLDYSEIEYLYYAYKALLESEEK